MTFYKGCKKLKTNRLLTLPLTVPRIT